MLSRRARKKQLGKYLRRGATIGAVTMGTIGAIYGARSGSINARQLFPKAGKFGRVIGAVDGGIQEGFDSRRLAAGALIGGGISSAVYKVKAGIKRKRRRRKRL